MGFVTGRDIILRMMLEVADLRSATDGLTTAVQTFATKTTASLDRMRITLEEMLEHQGQLEGRLDSHEGRILALEKDKTS